MPFCSLEVALFVQLAAAEGKDRSAREADAAAAADKLAKAEGRLRALRAEGLPKVRQFALLLALCHTAQSALAAPASCGPSAGCCSRSYPGSGCRNTHSTTLGSPSA